jgi:protein TonB
VTRREISPAALGSVALHGVIAAALLISWHFQKDLKIGSAVPVTIVSSMPDVDIRPAEQAPETQSAQTEAPVPDAALQSAPPRPQPQPSPPTPIPTPAPPKPTPPAPSPKAMKPAEKTPVPPAKPAPPTKADKGLDLDALAASVSKLSKASPAKPSSAAKGAARAETAPVARTAPGTGLSALAMNGMTQELQRRWNPNCDVEGGRNVIVKVTFRLGAGAQVAGQAKSEIVGARSAVSTAAAERAVRAVYAASPFRNAPREAIGQDITVTFNARDACS